MKRRFCKAFISISRQITALFCALQAPQMGITYTFTKLWWLMDNLLHYCWMVYHRRKHDLSTVFLFGNLWFIPYFSRSLCKRVWIRARFCKLGGHLTLNLLHITMIQLLFCFALQAFTYQSSNIRFYTKLCYNRTLSIFFNHKNLHHCDPITKQFFCVSKYKNGLVDWSHSLSGSPPFHGPMKRDFGTNGQLSTMTRSRGPFLNFCFRSAVPDLFIAGNKYFEGCIFSK